MNNLIYKTYTIKVSGIDWDLDDEWVREELPSNGIFEIKSTDHELSSDEVIEALTKEYGFCINSIDEIEVFDEVPGLGKRI